MWVVTKFSQLYVYKLGCYQRLHISQPIIVTLPYSVKPENIREFRIFGDTCESFSMKLGRAIPSYDQF